MLIWTLALLALLGRVQPLKFSQKQPAELSYAPAGPILVPAGGQPAYLAYAPANQAVGYYPQASRTFGASLGAAATTKGAGELAHLEETRQYQPAGGFGGQLSAGQLQPIPAAVYGQSHLINQQLTGPAVAYVIVRPLAPGQYYQQQPLVQQSYDSGLRSYGGAEQATASYQHHESSVGSSTSQEQQHLSDLHDQQQIRDTDVQQTVAVKDTAIEADSAAGLGATGAAVAALPAAKKAKLFELKSHLARLVPKLTLGSSYHVAKEEFERPAQAPTSQATKDTDTKTSQELEHSQQQQVQETGDATRDQQQKIEQLDIAKEPKSAGKHQQELPRSIQQQTHDELQTSNDGFRREHTRQQQQQQQQLGF